MTNTPTNEPQPQTGRGPIRAGQQLQGRYNLINRIATGGMGEVWRARDARTGTLVAAKVLRPELTGEEISLSRLRIEARNAMRANHPNIAAVLDSGESEGQGWIVMELVQGDPLTDYVGDGKRLTARELIPILSQTAFALDGAAQAGIVHRDIKPANIMVRADGMVKLTDFGISYTDGQANLTAVGMVMGTAQYLAPEQAMGAVATHSGDLYALGVIAYEALAGYRPFTGKSVVDIAMAHVNEPVPALPEDVPEPLAEVVYWLLAKDPEDRPASGTALVRTLNRVAEQLGTTTQPVPLNSRKAPANPTRSEPDGGPSAAHPEPQGEPGSARSTRPNPAAEAPVQSRTAEKPDPSHPARPAPVVRREWKPVTEDSASFRTDHSPSSSRPSPTDPVSFRSRTQRATPVPPTPGDLTSSHSSQTLPKRVEARKAQEAAVTGSGSNVGLWVIVGLVALTVVLIIIAMFRDHAEPSALGRAPVVSTASVHLEVEPWLTPIPVS